MECLEEEVEEAVLSKSYSQSSNRFMSVPSDMSKFLLPSELLQEKLRAFSLSVVSGECFEILSQDSSEGAPHQVSTFAKDVADLGQCVVTFEETWDLEDTPREGQRRSSVKQVKPGALRDDAVTSFLAILERLDSQSFSKEYLSKHLQKLGFKLRDLVTIEIFSEVTGELEWDEDRELDFAEFADFVFRFRRREGLSEEEVIMMKRVFMLCDVDRSGEISRKELEGAFHDLGYQMGRWEINDLFNEADMDDSGSLDMREYLHVVRLHREHDLKKIVHVFETYSEWSEDQGCQIMQAEDAVKAVRALGYDPTGMEEPPSETVYLDNFFDIVDKQRAEQVKLSLGKTGFDPETADRFRCVYDSYCIGGSEVLSSAAFSNLLGGFGRCPKNREAQEELTAAYQHSQTWGTKARGLTIHKISDEQRLVSNFPKEISFLAFMQLMELLENESMYEQELKVDATARKLNLIEREVTAFAKIFDEWSEAPSIWSCSIKQLPGGINSPGIFRNKMSMRCLWNFIKETFGTSISEKDKAALDKQLAKWTVHGQLDWLGFLSVMCFMVDTDFAGLSKLDVRALLSRPTTAASVELPPLPELELAFDHRVTHMAHLATGQENRKQRAEAARNLLKV
jgi:hypothetical protein